MSKILWRDSLIPGAAVPAVDFITTFYPESFAVPNTKTLPIVERNVELPDPRVYRSMSRAAVLLATVCLRAKPLLAEDLAADPFSVGIYCAVENGPVDFESTKNMVGLNRENFAELYKKHRNPKMYLKQLPNLAAAQMGIFLGVYGPMHVYNHSTQGSLSALEQAEMDLQAGRVRKALVCSSFSFENPLVVERVRRGDPRARTLCEGAGAILLAQAETETDWSNQDYFSIPENYGIAQQIIELALRETGGSNGN